MQIFYLIRHGETDWNKTGLIQGHTDIELNAEGRSQAAELSLFLKDLNIKNIVSSDLKRAVKTTELALPGRKFQTDARLREVFLGQAEGTERDKMRQSYGNELIDRWISAKPEDFEAHFPGGESRRQGVNRLKESIIEWTSTDPGSWAFFTHGLVMRSFAQDLSSKDSEHLRAPNCSVFEFGKIKPGQFVLRQIIWLGQN